MIIEFGSWEPDKANLVAGMTRAINVVAVAGGYESAIGFGRAAVDGPPSDATAMKAFESSDGLVTTFAFAPTRIYRLDTTTWTDVTRISADYAPTDRWEYVQWGDLVYAFNPTEPIQKYDLLQGGSTFDDIAATHRAHLACIVGDFILTFDTNNATATDPQPFRMHWSGRLRPEDYTPSLITQAGYRDVADIGRIVACIGGAYGLVLGTTGLARIDYIGPPLNWQITTLDEDVGCLYRNSVIKLGGVTYWYSPKGWRASAGGVSQGFGEGKVDAFSKTRFNPDKVNRMTVAALRDRPVIMISYVSVDSTDGYPDEALFYNTSTKQFTEGRYRVKFLGSQGSPSPLTDTVGYGDQFVDTDGEALIDARSDNVGQLIAVALSGAVMTSNNSPDNILISCQERQLVPGRRALATRARMLGDAKANATYMVRAETREAALNSTPRVRPWQIPGPTGSVPLFAQGRYHTFSFTGAGAFAKLIGIEVEASPLGVK